MHPALRTTTVPPCRCARLLALILFALPMLLCCTGVAAQCTTDLKVALDGWASSNTGDPVEIRLQVGAHAINIVQNKAAGSGPLTIKGGYLTNSCVDTARSKDASLTILNGGGGVFNLLFAHPLSISVLTFTGFLRTDYRGVSLFGFDIGATLTLDHVIGDGNSSMEFVGGGTTILRDVLVHGQPTVPTSVAALSIDSWTGVTTATNLTVVDNANAGLDLYSTNDRKISVFNSIVQHNSKSAPGGSNFYTNTASSNPPRVSHLITDYLGDCAGCQADHVKTQDAEFVGSGDYRVLGTSPAINFGTNNVTDAAGNNIGLPYTDIAGHLRVQNDVVDAGAYESADDGTGSKVYVDTTSDTTGKTLHAAINTANLYAGPTTITFQISGSCPQVIDLAGLLPDISSDVTIDGYSQPGSRVNSAYAFYDGQICIVLKGGTHAIDHALRTTGGGRLTVRGIEFEGFQNAAVDLATGSGHVVAGNSFSGSAGATANAIGVLIEGTASASQIGSADLGDRNVFVSTVGAALKLSNNGVGNHTIQGNYFGLNFDSTAREGMQDQFGILVMNSASNVISGNAIGGSRINAIRLTGAGSAGNVLKDNYIGRVLADGSAAGNGGFSCTPLCLYPNAAIDLQSGATNNVIGEVACGDSAPNYIIHNLGPGIAVESNAGTGNQICAYNNIWGNSGYLAIDLGAFGPSANDAGDVDGGGNNQQNYPVLSQALRIENDVVRVSGSLLSQTANASLLYRLDIYWTLDCVADAPDTTGNRGELNVHLGFRNLDGSKSSPAATSFDVVADEYILPSGYLVATATDAGGNTSEPGPCFPMTNDHIFGDTR